MMKVWVRHLDVTATMKEEIVSDFGNSHGEKFETFLCFKRQSTTSPKLIVIDDDRGSGESVVVNMARGA